jgi:hypothetical protein
MPNFKWTIENYGYPSTQKIGVWNDGVFMPMLTFMSHMVVMFQNPYFKNVLLVCEIGECSP